MGRTACTEPQYLKNGELYLYLTLFFYTADGDKDDPYTHGVTSRTTECLSVIFILGQNMMCPRTERVSST